MKNEMNSGNSAYKTEAQSVERLKELELRADLFKYQIDGYSAWRLLRFKMAGILQDLPFSAPTNSLGIGWVLERLIYFIREIPLFFFLKKKSVVAKTFSTALSEEQNGFYKDIYFDDLFENGDEFFKIETLNNPGYAKRRKKAFMSIAMTTAMVDLTSAFLSFMRIPVNSHHIASQIYKDIKLEFQGLALTEKDIQLSLLRFYWSKRIYKRFLAKIQPKITLSADTGEFAFWAAAQELGIPAIEFQHGVFSRTHPNAMNSSMDSYRKHLIVPDKIFLYGEYWKQQLILNEYYHGQLVAVGSPRIDRYRVIRKKILLNPDRHNEEIIILLTSQGLDRERLIAFMREFVDAANSKLRYTLYIKLHPAEKDKVPYTQIFKEFPQVHILFGFESPSTFELFVKADLHISIASASHYDALGLFVPTAVLPLAGHELVQNLVAAGHANPLHTPQDLVKLALNIHHHKVPEEVSHFYYEPGAVQNIKREIGLLK